MMVAAHSRIFLPVRNSIVSFNSPLTFTPNLGVFVYDEHFPIYLVFEISSSPTGRHQLFGKFTQRSTALADTIRAQLVPEPYPLEVKPKHTPKRRITRVLPTEECVHSYNPVKVG